MTSVLRRVDVDLEGLRPGQGPYVEVKDPCPVYAGGQWHLFGTGVTGPHRFEVLHATARELTGPWVLTDPVDVSGIAGTCVAAPGVVVADGRVHLFVQTDYNRFGGRVEHLVATDASASRFARRGTAITSSRRAGETGVYDAHPAVVAGDRYLVYSAFTTIGQPDIHLARSRSGTWDGPWQRLGPIVEHEHVDCHNQRGGPHYEWGLEGAQLVELPDGRVLLNAVCFVPGPAVGSRQRVFLAVGADPRGPFDVLGPVLTPTGGDLMGENGHATALVVDDALALFFQERDVDGCWRYGLATVELAALAETAARGRAA